MDTTFADRVIAFNKQLDFKGTLPDGISIMNPFRESEHALPVSSVFYKKYFSDDRPRRIIMGINPGRFGGGITGVPFTDPKRLQSECGITFPGSHAHEPSSVFVYQMIHAYGSVADFYQRFYINSLCPLGFTIHHKGGEKNYNYYDSKELIAATHDFIIANIRKQIALGIDTDVCYCMGLKNTGFLNSINDSHGFFKKVIALEHPRYIMQYKQKSIQSYLDKYMQALTV